MRRGLGGCGAGNNGRRRQYSTFLTLDAGRSEWLWFAIPSTSEFVQM